MAVRGLGIFQKKIFGITCCLLLLPIACTRTDVCIKDQSGKCTDQNSAVDTVDVNELMQMRIRVGNSNISPDDDVPLVQDPVESVDSTIMTTAYGKPYDETCKVDRLGLIHSESFEEEEEDEEAVQDDAEASEDSGYDDGEFSGEENIRRYEDDPELHPYLEELELLEAQVKDEVDAEAVMGEDEDEEIDEEQKAIDERDAAHEAVKEAFEQNGLRNRKLKMTDLPAPPAILEVSKTERHISASGATLITEKVADRVYCNHKYRKWLGHYEGATKCGEKAYEAGYTYFHVSTKIGWKHCEALTTAYAGCPDGPSSHDNLATYRVYEADKPIIFDMYPLAGSIAGGQLVTFRGAFLYEAHDKMQGKKDTASALKAPIQIIMADREGKNISLDCPLENFESRVSDVVCVAPALAEKDMIVVDSPLFIMLLKLTMTGLEPVRRPKAPDVDKVFSYTYSTGATPELISVSPVSAGPGDVITMQAFSCSGIVEGDPVQLVPAATVNMSAPNNDAEGTELVADPETAYGHVCEPWPPLRERMNFSDANKEILKNEKDDEFGAIGLDAIEWELKDSSIPANLENWIETQSLAAGARWIQPQPWLDYRKYWRNKKHRYVTRLTGRMNLDQGGVYEFQMQTLKEGYMKIDGKKRAGTQSHNKGTKVRWGHHGKIIVRLTLEAGMHKVEFANAVNMDHPHHSAMEVSYKGPDNGYSWGRIPESKLRAGITREAVAKLEQTRLATLDHQEKYMVPAEELYGARSKGMGAGKCPTGDLPKVVQFRCKVSEDMEPGYYNIHFQDHHYGESITPETSQWSTPTLAMATMQVVPVIKAVTEYNNGKIIVEGHGLDYLKGTPASYDGYTYEMLSGTQDFIELGPGAFVNDSSVQMGARGLLREVWYDYKLPEELESKGEVPAWSRASKLKTDILSAPGMEAKGFSERLSGLMVPPFSGSCRWKMQANSGASYAKLFFSEVAMSEQADSKPKNPQPAKVAPFFFYAGRAFTGNNNWENLASVFSEPMGGAMSIAVTAKFTNYKHCCYQRIIDFGNGRQKQNIVIAREHNNKNIYFQIYNAQGHEKRVRAHNAMRPDTTQSWLFTVSDGGMMRIYLEGILVGSERNGWTPPKIKRSKMYVGKSNWGDKEFTGEIKNLQFIQGVASWKQVYGEHDKSEVNFKTVRYSVTCEGHGDKDLGYKSNIVLCAKEAKKQGYKFFRFGKYSIYGRCYGENTAECLKFWSDSNYDIYTVTAATSETAAPVSLLPFPADPAIDLKGSTSGKSSSYFALEAGKAYPFKLERRVQARTQETGPTGWKKLGLQCRTITSAKDTPDLGELMLPKTSYQVEMKFKEYSVAVKIPKSSTKYDIKFKENTATIEADSGAGYKFLNLFGPKCTTNKAGGAHKVYEDFNAFDHDSTAACGSGVFKAPLDTQGVWTKGDVKIVTTSEYYLRDYNWIHMCYKIAPLARVNMFVSCKVGTHSRTQLFSIGMTDGGYHHDRKRAAQWPITVTNGTTTGDWECKSINLYATVMAYEDYERRFKDINYGVAHSNPGHPHAPGKQLSNMRINGFYIGTARYKNGWVKLQGESSVDMFVVSKEEYSITRSPFSFKGVLPFSSVSGATTSSGWTVEWFNGKSGFLWKPGSQGDKYTSEVCKVTTHNKLFLDKCGEGMPEIKDCNHYGWRAKASIELPANTKVRFWYWNDDTMEIFVNEKSIGRMGCCTRGWHRYRSYTTGAAGTYRVEVHLWQGGGGNYGFLRWDFNGKTYEEPNGGNSGGVTKDHVVTFKPLSRERLGELKSFLQQVQFVPTAGAQLGNDVFYEPGVPPAAIVKVATPPGVMSFTDVVMVGFAGAEMKLRKDVGKDQFNAMFKQCPVVKYTYNGAVYAIYERTSAIPASFDAYTLFTNTWASKDNKINSDFKLYSTEADFGKKRNPWKYCNYDSQKTGFPRDCGKTGHQSCKYFRMPDMGGACGAYATYGFSIQTEGCASLIGTKYVAPKEATFKMSDDDATISQAIMSVGVPALEATAVDVDGMRWLDMSKMTARQSSRYHNGYAKNAIDGQPSKTDWGQQSCTHTNPDDKPWWSVSLGSKVNVAKVKIVARNCCTNQLRGAIVSIDGKVCTEYLDIHEKQTKIFDCIVSGSTLTVSMPKKESLVICEVQIGTYDGVPQAVFTSGADSFGFKFTYTNTSGFLPSPVFSSPLAKEVSMTTISDGTRFFRDVTDTFFRVPHDTPQLSFDPWSRYICATNSSKGCAPISVPTPPPNKTAGNASNATSLLALGLATQTRRHPQRKWRLPPRFHTEETLEKMRRRVFGYAKNVKGWSETSALLQMHAGHQIKHFSETDPRDDPNMMPWSDPKSWGGDTPPNKESTDIVYIPEGKTAKLDMNVNIRFWVIEGNVVWDQLKNIHMEAEAIVVNGGQLLIGSEKQPYAMKGQITLHGHWHTFKLPLCGAKTIFQTRGNIEMHGLPVAKTWTELETTAFPDDLAIKVFGSLDWQPGNMIVIAASDKVVTDCRLDRRDGCQVEERFIQNIEPGPPSDAERGGPTTIIYLDRPLVYRHVAEELDAYFPDDYCLHTKGLAPAACGKTQVRAEVGLLSRNIVVKGSNYHDGSGPAGSEGFGGHLMHAEKAKYSYIEFFWMGQAFQMGRYPLHLHLTGFNPTSYIKGCSLHRTFMRGITVHGTHSATIKDNVLYNVMAHGYFIEDGNEHNNLFENNLGMMVHKSFSALVSDQTPAVFWIRNPSNYFRNNHAAGGAAFGFWFDTHGKAAQLGIRQFEYNTAHSNGGTGIWIDIVDPRKGCTADPGWTIKVPGRDSDEISRPVHDKAPSCGGQREINKLEHITTWGNGRFGMTLFETGHLHLINHRSVSDPNGILVWGIQSDDWPDPTNGFNGPTLMRGVYSTVSSLPFSSSCSIGGPWDDTLMVYGTQFIGKVNKGHFCPCFECLAMEGGYETRTAKLGWHMDAGSVSSVRARWPWLYASMFFDMDGSLTENTKDCQFSGCYLHAPFDGDHAGMYMRRLDPNETKKSTGGGLDEELIQYSSEDDPDSFLQTDRTEVGELIECKKSLYAIIKPDKIKANRYNGNSASFGKGQMFRSNIYFDGDPSYCGHRRTDDYVEYDLGEPTWVTGVQTRGRRNHDQWLKSYQIQYTEDGTKWVMIDKLFQANRNRNTIVENRFQPVKAIKIRLLSKSWQSHNCFRLDFLGCDGALPLTMTCMDSPYLDTSKRNCRDLERALGSKGMEKFCNSDAAKISMHTALSAKQACCACGAGVNVVAQNIVAPNGTTDKAPDNAPIKVVPGGTGYFDPDLCKKVDETGGIVCKRATRMNAITVKSAGVWHMMMPIEVQSDFGFAEIKLAFCYQQYEFTVMTGNRYLLVPPYTPKMLVDWDVFKAEIKMDAGDAYVLQWETIHNPDGYTVDMANIHKKMICDKAPMQYDDVFNNNQTLIDILKTETDMHSVQKLKLSQGFIFDMYKVAHLPLLDRKGEDKSAGMWGYIQANESYDFRYWYPGMFNVLITEKGLSYSGNYFGDWNGRKKNPAEVWPTRHLNMRSDGAGFGFSQIKTPMSWTRWDLALPPPPGQKPPPQTKISRLRYLVEYCNFNPASFALYSPAAQEAVANHTDVKNGKVKVPTIRKFKWSQWPTDLGGKPKLVDDLGDYGQGYGNVSIEANWEVTLDEDVYFINKLNISGVLKFEDKKGCCKLTARFIFVGPLFGKIEAGTEAQPISNGIAHIILKGQPMTPPLRHFRPHIWGSAKWLKSKFLAVQGSLSLHGKTRSKTFAKILKSAPKGSPSIVVDGGDFKVGDVISIKDGAETKKIMAVMGGGAPPGGGTVPGKGGSGSVPKTPGQKTGSSLMQTDVNSSDETTGQQTLLLDSPLELSYKGADYAYKGKSETAGWMAAYVGLVDGYNVIVEGEDTPGVPMCHVSKTKRCPYADGLGGGMNLHDFAKEMRHYLEKTGAAQHPNCRPCLAVSEMAFAGYIIGMAHFHYQKNCPKDHGVVDVTGVVFKHGSNLRLYHGFTGGNYPDDMASKNFPAAWYKYPHVWWKDPVWAELKLPNLPVPSHQIAHSAFNNTHTGAAFALANAGLQVFPTKPVINNVILASGVGINGAARPIRDIPAYARDAVSPVNDNMDTMSEGVGGPTGMGTFGDKTRHKQGSSSFQFINNFLIGSTLVTLNGGGGSRVVTGNVITGPVYMDGCPTTSGQTCFSSNVVTSRSTSGCIYMRGSGTKGISDNTVFGCKIAINHQWVTQREGKVARMKILDSTVGINYWANGPDSKAHDKRRTQFQVSDVDIYAKEDGSGTAIRNPKVHANLLGNPVAADWFHGGANVFPMGHSAPTLFFKSMLYNIKFVGFSKGAGGVALSVGEGHRGDSSDADYYPVITRGLTFDGTAKDAYMRFAKPSGMGNAGVRQCIQIECDGRRNSLIIDEDGTLIGSPGTVVSAPYRFYDKLKYVDPMGFDTMEDLIPMPVRYDAVGDAIPFPTGVDHGTGGGLEYECNEQAGCDVLFMQRYGSDAGKWLPDFNKTLQFGDRIVAIREDGGHIFLDPLHHGWDYALSTVYTKLCNKTMDPSWSNKPESQHARRYGRVGAGAFGAHINASKIPSTAGPVYTVPGIYRKGCTYNAAWGSYECPKSRHRHLLIEVMDWNHMVRRWAPVSVEVNDNYMPQGGAMNILTGPAMYWTQPNMRLQTFHALGHIGLRHNVYFSADPPSHLRLHLQHASPSEGVVVCVYYGLPNLIAAYVGGSKKEPLTIPTWDNLVFAYLNSSMPHGTYYYDRIGVETRRPGYLYVVIRGDQHADFKISHKIVLTSKVTVTSTWGGWKDDTHKNGSSNDNNNDFYKKGINGLVRNIALLIGAPPNKVAILGQGKAKKGTFWNNDTTSSEFAKWMWEQNKSMDRKTMKEWASTPGAKLKKKQNTSSNVSFVDVHPRHVAFLQQFSEESRSVAAEALVQEGQGAHTWHHKLSLLSTEEQLMVQERRVSDMLEAQGEAHYQALRLLQEGAFAEEEDDDNDTFTLIFDSESDVMPATLNSAQESMKDGKLLEQHDIHVTQLSTEDKGMKLLDNCVPNGTSKCTLPAGNGTFDVQSAETDYVPTKNNPKGWLCDEDAYEDGAVCHCDCGIWDPDCDLQTYDIDPALLNSTDAILLLDKSQAKMAISWVDKNYNGMIDSDEELSIPTLGASALYSVAETIMKAQEQGNNVREEGVDRIGNFAWLETVRSATCEKLLVDAPLTPKLATYTPKCVKDTIFDKTLGQPTGRCSIQPTMKIGSQCFVPGGGFYPAPARGVNQSNDGSICGAVLKIFRGGLGAGGTMSTGNGPSSAEWFHPGGTMIPGAAGVLAPIDMKTMSKGLQKMELTNSFDNGFSFYCRIKFHSWARYARIFSFYSHPYEPQGAKNGRLEAYVYNGDDKKLYDPKMSIHFGNENWRSKHPWHRNHYIRTQPVPRDEEMQLLFVMTKEKLTVIKNSKVIGTVKNERLWDYTPDFSKVKMFIGRKADGAHDYLDADLSDIRVWTRPVTWDVAVQGVPPSQDTGNPPPDDDGEDLEVPCLSSKINTYDFACQAELSKELAEQLGYGEDYKSKTETDKFEKRAKMGDITICTDKASTKGVVFAGKFGDGLTAEYYRMYQECHRPPFTFGKVPAVVRVDKKVQVPLDFKAPKNQYAIRWGGKLLIHTAGDYEFQLTVNDGAWLAVDSFLTVQADGCRHQSQTRTVTSKAMTMSAGGHDIAILYFNKGPEGNSKDATIELRYKGADSKGAMIPIPTENLGSDPLRLAKLAKDTDKKDKNTTEIKVTPYGKFIYDEDYGVALMPKGSCDFMCQKGYRKTSAAQFKFFCKTSTEVSFKAEVGAESKNAMIWFDDDPNVVIWELLAGSSLLQKSSLTMNATMSEEAMLRASLGLDVEEAGRDYSLTTSLESPKKTLLRGTHKLFFQGRPLTTEIFALKYLMFEKGKEHCQFYLEGKDTHFDQC